MRAETLSVYLCPFYVLTPINDAGQQIIRRQLNIAPTLTIRPGFPVRVIVTRDLILEPYGG